MKLKLLHKYVNTVPVVEYKKVNLGKYFTLIKLYLPHIHIHLTDIVAGDFAVKDDS